MKKTYSELLRDPRWQKKRLLIFERDNWTCTECRCKDDTLNVHHLSYSGLPWEADDSSLVTLCQGCHDLEESLKKNDLLLRYSKELNVTCILVWRIMGAVVFTKKHDNEKWTLISNTLNGMIQSNHSKYNEFLRNG